jgi:hypothetical protein
MGRMSNRERIARAAEEARLAEAEAAAKKATRSRPKKAPKPVRMKIVWEVCDAAGTARETFAYPDKALAEAATQALTQATGRLHVLRAARVAME